MPFRDTSFGKRTQIESVKGAIPSNVPKMLAQMVRV